jgi:DNA repair protein RecN (Recombination protein N)
MLTALRVDNLAIIDRLEVGFESGLTVITGETGAGKSILIHALKLVLGGRASPEVVRNGADRAEVEALFSVGDDPAFRSRLREADLPDDDEIVIRRSVTANGRSRATINGRLTTATQLQVLAAGLIDISSQHEHQSLSDPSTHLATLDAYAGEPRLVEQVRGAVAAAIRAAEALAAAQQQLQNRADREDLLRFQLAEIAKLDPRPGELDQLAEEVERLRHGDRLRAAASGGEDLLYGRDGAVCGELGGLEADLEAVVAFDPALEALLGRVQSARVELEDVAGELGRYARRIDGDPEQLARLDDRLHALKRLTRRHGSDLDAMIDWRHTAEAELAALTDAEGLVEQARAESEAALEAAGALAERLSAVRQGAAASLGGAIAAELSDLGMGGAQIVVEVAPLEPGGSGLVHRGRRLGPSGIDRVELLIAPNPGEPPRPLRRIASGGELSRALLGTKRVLSGLGPVGTYVFDEVDTGVGGAVADAIGRKLVQVAHHHQVLCITHQPQIAAFADQHLVVGKQVVEGRTSSRLRRLDAPARIEELARMLGGRKVTDAARGAAESLIRAAQ